MALGGVETDNMKAKDAPTVDANISNIGSLFKSTESPATMGRGSGWPCLTTRGRSISPLTSTWHTRTARPWMKCCGSSASSRKAGIGLTPVSISPSRRPPPPWPARTPGVRRSSSKGDCSASSSVSRTSSSEHSICSPISFTRAVRKLGKFPRLSDFSLNSVKL